MGTKTQKQRKCCYHNLNAKQLSIGASNIPKPRICQFFLMLGRSVSFIVCVGFFLTEILHHSQKALGAGSPRTLKPANRLDKPARPHEKSP